MHFAPTKFATGGCSGPGQVLRIHFCPGFVFLYLRKLLSPDTDLREVYSGILAWRVCWLEKENLARRRESESTPVERSLRQQEPPSLVSQINSTNIFRRSCSKIPFSGQPDSHLAKLLSKGEQELFLDVCPKVKPSIFYTTASFYLTIRLLKCFYASCGVVPVRSHQVIMIATMMISLSQCHMMIMLAIYEDDNDGNYDFNDDDAVINVYYGACYKYHG